MNEVNLYINGKEVEFSVSPDILFTYQLDDLTNPTIVKNTYTKTISIEGTDRNNDIFNHFWSVERIQGIDNFNASKRVPFELFVNGDIYQKGYAKLDKVIRNTNGIRYDITLYGGLGSFLYNLSTDWYSGEKKTLADLDFGEDLSFTINKDTVSEAWSGITGNTKWSKINFASCYEGIPENLDSDKAIINFNDFNYASAITDGGKTYTPSNGYSLATLPEQMTSEQVRDYRSYLQTPVIRVKSIIDAICDPSNNKGMYDNGFQVDLDSEFFSQHNPYYNNAWMTLPLLTSLEYSTNGGGGTSAFTPTTISYRLNNKNGVDLVIDFDEAISGYGGSMSVAFDYDIYANTQANALLPWDYSSINATAFQAYATNSSGEYGDILAASRVKWLTLKTRNNTYFTPEEAINKGYYTPYKGAAVDMLEGAYGRNGNYFRFQQRVELTTDLPAGTVSFVISLKRINSKNNDSDADKLYQFGDPIIPYVSYLNPIMENSSFTLTEGSDESYTNKYVDSSQLLSTSYSPAEWLLSYCKTFGLYMFKDKVEDKIYIRTRNNFFNREKVTDIEKNIDRGNNFEIDPIYCKYGFFTLSNEGENSRTYEDYKSKYGKIYGQKTINTGYDFNADSNELNKGVFKNSVQTKEVSQYFYQPDIMRLQPYIYNGFSYPLYENGESTGSTFEIKLPRFDISQYYEPYDADFPGYDLMSKPMFANKDNKGVDNSSVMLFFNGYENVNMYRWFLSDDMEAMYRLNNNPTWLLTKEEYDLNGNKIAVRIVNMPKFSRWFEGNDWMVYSWDYGSPRELYVPEMVDNEDANIYHNYFKKYYADLYDVDTRVVDCYVTGLAFDEESLRSFYWFDNSIWRLNKVVDYNPMSYNTVKCQFVKVQDLANMTNEDATTAVTITIVLDRYTIGPEGTTIDGYIKTNYNMAWEYSGFSTTYGSVEVSPQSGTKNSPFSVTIPDAVRGGRTITLYFTAGDAVGSVDIQQQGPYIYLIPSSIAFNSEGGVATVNVESNVSWNAVLSGETSITGITIENFAWVSDFPYSAGSYSTKDYSTFNVVAGYDDGTYADVTSEANISGLVTLEENTGSTRKTVFAPIAAYYEGFTTSEIKTGYQAANEQPTPTGYTALTVTISAPDVPASGGVLSYSDCDYHVYATDTEGVTTEVTSEAVVQGNTLNVSATTQTERHYVGAIMINASYAGFMATNSVMVYQEGYVPPQPVTVNDYLTFDIISGNGYIYWKCTDSNTYSRTIEYEKNDSGEWYTLESKTGNTSWIPVTTGDKVKVRGNLTGTGYDNYYSYFAVSDVNFKLKGNIMSLIDSAGFATATTISSYGALQHLFENNTGLTDAGDMLIPVITYRIKSMQYMFKGCTNLIRAPYIYETASLMENCCMGMFSGCTSLNYIKCLFNTTYNPGDSCTGGWVDGVASSGTFVKNANMTNWTTGVSGIPTNWVIQDDDSYTSYITNNTTTQISGTIVGLGTPDTISLASGETMNRYDTLPLTITEAYLTGIGLSSGTLTISNSQEQINCVWDSNANAFIGTGSITLTTNYNTLTISYN